MQAIREILDVKDKSVIVHLPDSIKTDKVEVIVFPFENLEAQRKFSKETFDSLFPKRKLGRIKNSLNREDIYDDER